MGVRRVACSGRGARTALDTKRGSLRPARWRCPVAAVNARRGTAGLSPRGECCAVTLSSRPPEYSAGTRREGRREVSGRPEGSHRRSDGTVRRREDYRVGGAGYRPEVDCPAYSRQDVDHPCARVGVDRRRVGRRREGRCSTLRGDDNSGAACAAAKTTARGPWRTFVGARGARAAGCCRGRRLAHPWRSFSTRGEPIESDRPARLPPHAVRLLWQSGQVS